MLAGESRESFALNHAADMRKVDVMKVEPWRVQFREDVVA